MAVIGRPVGAAGIVGAGVVVAALVAALPAFGASDHATIVTPSPAGQRLVCPGGVIAVGVDGRSADSLSAPDAPQVTSGTPSGEDVETERLAAGEVSGPKNARPRLLTAPAALEPDSILAAAEAQAVADGDARGLAATECIAPTGSAWLVAGATTTGRTSILLLANPSDVPAAVTIGIWTDRGPVESAGLSGIAVPAKGRRAISLASLAPSSAGIALRVTSVGGQVAAAVEQRVVRGLESGGVDLAGPVAAPAREQFVPGVRVAQYRKVLEAAEDDDYADLRPVVRIAVPGPKDAVVQVTALGGAGEAATLKDRKLKAGTVTDVEIPGLEDGTYTIRVQSNVPVATGARTAVIDADAPAIEEGETPTDAAIQTEGDTITSGTVDPAARGLDLAWLASGRPLGPDTAVAVADGAEPQLTFTNPTRQQVTLTLSGAVDTDLGVPAGRTVAIDVPPGVVRIVGGGEVLGAVTYAGDGGVAGYPVTPADQGARPVAVTH